jgi:hypothetical protein
VADFTEGRRQFVHETLGLIGNENPIYARHKTAS